MRNKYNFLKFIATGLAIAGLWKFSSFDTSSSDESKSKSAMLEESVEAEDKPFNKQDDREDNPADFASYTAQFEGIKTRVYDPNPRDGKAEPTIGVGHYLARGDSRETFNKVLPDVNFDVILNGKLSLTKEQALKLFSHDIQSYIQRTKRIFSDYENYPEYLQQALVDGVYRGDLSGSPKTIKLINDGKWREAADEYINRKDYQNAVRNGMRGVKTRMDSNRERMLRYAEESRR